MARKKKSENTASTRKKTVYELVGERSPLIRRGMDPLDDLLLDEERELSREFKRLKLEQIIAKRRLEVEKMRDGTIDGGPLASNTDFLNMAKFLSELSPEEAQRVRNAYSFFKLSEKGGSSSMQLLPMMLGYARNNPGASEGQMINYLKLMDSQLLKGIELSKLTNPNPEKADQNAMQFLTLMKDLIIDGVRNPLMTALRESQPSPGVFEQILTKPELFTRAKEIGMFGSSSNAETSRFDLEIEKLRGERDLSNRKMDLEWKRDMLKRESEDRRTEMLIQAFGPAVAGFAGQASEKMRMLGKQQAYTHNPNNPATPTPSETTPLENEIQILCSCGYKGMQPLTSPLNCPSCGLELQVNTPGTMQEDEGKT